MEALNLQDTSSKHVTLYDSATFPESWIDHSGKLEEVQARTQSPSKTLACESYWIKSSKKSIHSAPDFQAEDIASIFESYPSSAKKTSRLFEENIAISNEAILTGLIADLNNADLTKRQAGWTRQAIQAYFRANYDEEGIKDNRKVQRMTILMGYALLTIMELKNCLESELTTQYERYLFGLGQKQALRESIKTASELEKLIRVKQREMKKVNIHSGLSLFGNIMEELAVERKKILTHAGDEHRKKILTYWITKICTEQTGEQETNTFYFEKDGNNLDISEDTCLGIDIDLKEKLYESPLDKIEQNTNDKNSNEQTASQCTSEDILIVNNTENNEKYKSIEAIPEENVIEIYAQEPEIQEIVLLKGQGDDINPNEDDDGRLSIANRQSLPSTCDTSNLYLSEQHPIEQLEQVFELEEEIKSQNQTMNRSQVIQNDSKCLEHQKSQPIITVDQSFVSYSESIPIDEDRVEKLVFQILCEKGENNET